MAQSIIFLPTIMSSAVMGLVFYLLFNAYNGEVNKMLMSVHIINRPINWLGKDHAMQTLIITAIWGWCWKLHGVFYSWNPAGIAGCN